MQQFTAATKDVQPGRSNAAARPVRTNDRAVDWRSRLQRVVGNQAVLRLLQSGAVESAANARSLPINDLEDPHEQAAERTADVALRTPDRAAATSTSPTSSGHGHPLPEQVRMFMESRFNSDFSGVRIHTNEAADELARTANADAFTVDQQVVFAAGRYAPETVHGTRLLAHELAHTIQQRGAGPVRVQRAPRSSGPTPAVRDAGLETRVEQLEQEAKRSRNRAQAIFHLDSFREEVMRRATSWQRAALRVGSAYAYAADQHKSTLEKQAKLEALGTQAFFSVLTIATAGGLSWLSSVLQARKVLAEGVLLTEVLEDAMQAAGGEGFSAMGVQLMTPVVSPVGIHPQVFQNERVDAILAAEESAHAYFARTSAAFQKAPPEFWDSYDETRQKGVFDAWLSKADLLKGEENLPDTVTMAFDLERGFWAEWAQVLAVRAVGVAASVFRYGKQKPNDPYNLTVYSSPGRAVEARLDDLRITQEAGIEAFGWYTSEAEIDKLVAWGRAYRVKPFVPGEDSATNAASARGSFVIFQVPRFW